MAATAYEIKPGYLIGDRYQVVRQLGEGGMGQVYLVQHAATEERFALKLLNADVVRNTAARERFRREARTPARIDSDHVCRVVDTDIAEDLGGAPYLVMEFLRGKNLDDLSDEIGPLPPREVVVYLRQVALALDRAHAIGVVHRDLKPENLFLTARDDGSPCVKVLDFGIAKLSGATGDLVKLKATSTGDVFGTPLYMSPEQCKSEADKISSRTDVWALGLIAFRLLVGHAFWTADTLTHLIAQIAYEPMPLASQRGSLLGPAFDAWFARCCAREPADRFASAREAVEELAAALAVEVGSAPTALLAADVARRAQISQDPPAFKQTSAALTRDQPGESSRRGRIGALFAAIVVGASLGVIGVAWLKGSFSEDDLAPVAGERSDPAPVETVVVAPSPAAVSPSAPAVSSSAPAVSSSAPVPKSVPVQPKFRAPSPPPPPPAQPTVDPLSGRH